MDHLLQSVDWWRALHPVLRVALLVGATAGIGACLALFSQLALPLPASLRWSTENWSDTPLLLRLGVWISLPLTAAVALGGVFGILTAVLIALAGLNGAGVALFLALPMMFWGLSLFVAAVFTAISRHLAKLSPSTTEPKSTKQSEEIGDEHTHGVGLLVFATAVAAIAALSATALFVLKPPEAPWWARIFFALLLGGLTWVFVVTGTVAIGSEEQKFGSSTDPGIDADDYSRDMFGPGGRTGAL